MTTRKAPSAPVRQVTGPRPKAPADDALRKAVRQHLSGQARLQAKPVLGPPSDSFEREADQVADRVAAGAAAPMVQRMATAGRKEPDGHDKKMRRKSSLRQPDDDAGKTLRRKAAEDPGALGDAAERALASRGSGHALAPGTRQRLESGLGADLGMVRVHDDAAAHAAARELHARAFTHGHDIWLGQGESQGDIRLMAHEATHVLQQDAGLVQRVVQRASKGAAEPAYASPTDLYQVKTLFLPKIKHRLADRYNNWGTLDRLKTYKRGTPDQQSKWLAADAIKLPAAKLKALDIDLAKDPDAEVPVKLGDKKLTLGAKNSLVKDLKIPAWDRHRKLVTADTHFEVDHQVELQVSGWPQNGRANTFDNFELLDRRSNGTSGGDVWKALRVSIAEQLRLDKVLPEDADLETRKDKVREIIRDKGAHFQKASKEDWPKKAIYEPMGDALASTSEYWSKTEIENGEHLDLLTHDEQLGEVGSAERYAVLGPSRTSKLTEFEQASGKSEQRIVVPPDQQQSVAGLKLTALTLKAGYRDAKKNESVGTLEALFDPGQSLKGAAQALKFKLARQEANTGYISGMPALAPASFVGMSPVSFGHVGIDGKRLVGHGELTPTLPLLGQTLIDIELDGQDIEFSHTFAAEELRLPVPGLTIEQSTLLIGAGTAGLRAEGVIDFSIRGAGTGSLSASFNAAREFEAAGRFNFDSKLFDKALIEVRYHGKDNRFSGAGELAITKPDRVRGIRSAEARVTLDAGAIDATGTIKPTLPAIDEGSFALHYKDSEGLLLSGKLLLSSKAPGLRSGQLAFAIQQRDGDWKLHAEGEAEPAIPGLDSRFTINYDDGAFDAHLAGQFHRGLLAGQVAAGVTNRALDEQGAPAGPVAPDARLAVYGGGRVALQVAPWLQAAAGLRFQPDGEVAVAGEVSLPKELQIFPRMAVKKSLFDLAVQVPIAPGVVAEIGGGLEAEAGAGPGVIDELRLGVDYNPSHEDRTRVTGDAHLSVPADAGLQLNARAGIGLGITGASATGGLQIGGQLGIAGAATAAAHVEWAPGKPLKLAAEGKIAAEPKFRFKVAGYVNVRVLGASLYDRTWDLAAYEFGPQLRFEAQFPITYTEGQPFSLDLNQVRFVVPPIDARQLLQDLVRQIAE